MFEKQMYRVLSVIVVIAMVFGSFGVAMQNAAVVPDVESLLLNELPDVLTGPISETLPVMDEWLGSGVQKSIPSEELTTTSDEYSTNSISGSGSKILGSVPTDWSFRDPHNVPSVHDDLKITGDGVTVAIADTGIDFGVDNLAGKYLVDNATYHAVNETVTSSSAIGQDNVSLPHTKIVSGTLKLWVSGTELSSGYTVNYDMGEIKFDSPLSTGSIVVASYDYRPYYEWPTAFDPYAMTAYLGTSDVASGVGGYVNTSVNGTGPFSVSHTINMDGKNDFSPLEMAGSDLYNDVRDTSTKYEWEFDLENLYTTRDEVNWYVGINTRYASANRTFGFAIDMDGAKSGGLTDPYGNYLDFEPSHTAPVEQISYTSANGGMLASCSGKKDKDDIKRLSTSSESNVVKIWNANGNLLQTLGYEDSAIFSVAWSSDGSMLAYQSIYDIVILSANNWTEKSRTTYRFVPVGGELDFSRESMTFSPDDGKLIIGSKSGISDTVISVLDVATGALATYNLDYAQSIVYSPDKTKIAMGHKGYIGVYDTAFTLLKSFPISGNEPVESVAWDTTSSFIAAGKNANGTVEIWNYASATVTKLYGHGQDATINSVIWDASGIITGGSDGRVIFWGISPFLTPVICNNRFQQPVYSLSKNPVNGNIFVGGRDCTIRRYLADWSDYTPFSSKKPDVLVYIKYEREYYTITPEGTEVSKQDQIKKPLVYKWNVTTNKWDETDLATVGGEYMYKGSSAGAWTALGFIEWSIPRNYVGWNTSGFMNITAWVCSGDKKSQPQDTVPSDSNVPSPRIPDWSATNIIGISSWGSVEISQVTIDDSIPSQSGYYYFGTHPSKELTNLFGPTSLIVVDKTKKGVFDTVYIDMNGDKVIDSSDVCVDRNNPVATRDFYNFSAGAPGPDGYADISGGMLYFIGDGKTPLPYAYRMAELIEMPISVDTPMPIPKNGEFIAFFGDFDIDFEGKYYTQGTKMASVIAGAGKDYVVNNPILGVSPDVTFLPICNSQYDLANSLYFAAEGYDGKPNTGDEADIVVTGQYSSGYNSGMDATTQLIEFLATAHSNYSTTFVAPAGEDGSGYGTVAAPAGANLIVVGAAEDSAFNGGSSSELHHFGQVAEWSSRGPTAAGLMKPDVIATAWGEVDLPLGASGSLSSSIGGANSSRDQQWSSSQLAAAVATGTLALMFEAYHSVNKVYPGSALAMDILTGSAKDLGLDPFTQGSGFIDAYAAVLTAKGSGGIYASTFKTAFGNTFGQQYSSFVNGLKPGESTDLAATFTNTGNLTEPIDYALEYLIPINKTEYTFTFGGANKYRKDLSALIPPTAQVVKITAQTVYDEFITSHASYAISLHDWVDFNGDGIGGTGTGEDSADYYGILTTTDYLPVNSMICTASTYGLSGRLQVRLDPDMWAGIILTPRPWTMTIESFAVSDWPWLTINKTTDTIGSKATSGVKVTANVPAGAEPGTYGGMLVGSYGKTDASFSAMCGPTVEFNEQFPPIELASQLWDDGAKGNYWDDYTTKYPGAGNDTVVWDTPYDIPALNSQDGYPLVDQADVFSKNTVIVPWGGSIEINGDDEFIEANGVSMGDGTAGNPYIIENWNCTYIIVQNTRAHFIIRNCIVYDVIPGIYIDNVKNGTVRDCFINRITGNDDGILVQSSSDILLASNIIRSVNGDNAIKITNSARITVTGNSIDKPTNPGMTGLFIDHMDDGIILSNFFNDSGYGIWAEYTVNSSILDNVFSNITDDYAMYLYESYSNRFFNNIFENNVVGHVYEDSSANDWDDGVSLGNYWDDWTSGTYAIDGGSSVDNFPLATRPTLVMISSIPRVPISINGDADFTQANGVSMGNGTVSNPFIIENWYIDANGGNAISIQDTTLYYVIKNCLITDTPGTGTGIRISNAPNGSISYCEVKDALSGIHVTDTPNFLIFLNTVTDNSVGIWVGSLNDVVISHNELSGNGIGIQTNDVETTEIYHNTIVSSTNTGLRLESSGNVTVNNNTFLNNALGMNNTNGAWFSNFYHNNFIGNVKQAYDDYGETLTEFDAMDVDYWGWDLTDSYYVSEAEITVNSVLLGSQYYSLDRKNGLITFSPTITGGNTVVITASFTPNATIEAEFRLPHRRILNTTANPVELDIYHINLDDTTEKFILGTHYYFYPTTGIIQFASGIPMSMGIFVYANYTYYNRTTIIPLALNVLIPTNTNWEVGNLSSTPDAFGIMPVNGLRSGYGTTLESGDRRYFYFYVPNQGRFFDVENFYMYLEATWDLNFTDVNMVFLGRGSSQVLFGEIAPYTMKKLGGSEEKANFEFVTTTSGPKEILIMPFSNEVLTVCMTLKSNNGTGDPVQSFEARGGWIQPSDKSAKTWSNSPTGSLNVTFMSSIDLSSGVYASIVGPAQGTSSVEDVYFDDPSNIEWTLEGWQTYLANGKFTRVVTVENALSWDVHCIGHPNTVDLDLAIFLDGANGQPKDGLAQWQEVVTQDMVTFECYGDAYGTGNEAYSADADADEAVKFINPPDGDYIIKVLGFTLLAVPAQFDLELKTILAGVEGYKLNSPSETEHPDENPSGSIYSNSTIVPAFEPRTFNIQWAFPEGTSDGAYGGIFVFGVSDAPKLIVSSIDIIFDREAPDVFPDFMGPGSITSNRNPIITAKIEDLARGEIDPNGATVIFDGVDVTDISTVSVKITENSAAKEAYWTGDIIFQPKGPLSDGGHFIQIEAKDKAGNVGLTSWGFTVDTQMPSLTSSAMLLDTDNIIYTNTHNLRLTGSAETSSVVSIVGVPGTVTQGSPFIIDLVLEDGSNELTVNIADSAGNINQLKKKIVLDTLSPTFTRVVALDGSNTNKRTTGIYGEMSEAGTLQINGVPVPINSDGTFRREAMQLKEGPNTQVLAFTDLAGNVAFNYLNITLDTAAPTLMLADFEKIVYEESLNISGTTEAGAASLTINGKLVSVGASGNFQQNLQLSPGTNTIVVETKDRAGNSAQEVLTVNYVTDVSETNWAAISLMIVLLVVGLILGMFFGPMILGLFGGTKGEAPPEGVEPEGVVPEEDQPVEDEMPESEVPTEGEEMEAISEDVPEGEVPDAEVMPEEPVPETEAIPDGAEPIPPEESMPEAEPPEAESEELLTEPAPAEPEDPRIAKLTEAYNSGKISKELYEKNLAKFKGQ